MAAFHHHNSSDSIPADGNFPVAFNIILILGVFLTASLLAICYALGGMDPGRNSIIYRMASQRIKSQ